jgi:predicted nuclease of restriction endonuclease-like (RecB) superfamily
MELNMSLPEDYKNLLTEVKQRIRSAQYEALKAVNKQLIELYWDIGKTIVTRQQGASWGKSVVEQLAKDLQAEFPGISGFSARNIWRMRDFYLTYQASEKLTPLVAEIGWTHNLVILEKCKDDLEREFYIRMTRKFGWTKNVLIHQIENQTYEKTLLNQTNFDRALSEADRDRAKLAVKDEYTFDFLNLGEEYSERQLEQEILAKLPDENSAIGIIL